MDNAITQAINGFAGNNAALDTFVIYVTKFGVPLLLVLVVAQWWLGKSRPTARYACVSAGASFALGLGLAQIMLLFIHRARPYDAGISHLIVPQTVDWSFPSDHAIASMSIVWTYLLLGLRKWAGIFFGIAAAVCLSRIYVGMHYASDILGGALVALIAAVIVQRFYKPASKLNLWLSSLF